MQWIKCSLNNLNQPNDDQIKLTKINIISINYPGSVKAFIIEHIFIGKIE